MTVYVARASRRVIHFTSACLSYVAIALVRGTSLCFDGALNVHVTEVHTSWYLSHLVPCSYAPSCAEPLTQTVLVLRPRSPFMLRLRVDHFSGEGLACAAHLVTDGMKDMTVPQNLRAWNGLLKW